MNLKGKKLLILGAGIHQVPLIETAKKMGVETHVCSIFGNYPGISLAPFFYEVDISNPKKVLKLAKRLEIDGILTTATDVCLESIGFVVDELNLSGTGLENSKACFDKSIMKKRFLLNNIPTSKYIKVEKLQDAIDFFNNQPSSCVLKPTDSSGSRGVIKVEDVEDIEQAYITALRFSKAGDVIIEEWLEGEEFGAQVVVVNGKSTLMMMHSDITTPPPNRVPIGHGCPHPQETKLFTLVSEIIHNAVIALGVNNTICNIDFILTKCGPKVIELTCRMGGTHLPEVCGTYWGINLYKLAIELSLGAKPPLPQTPSGPPNAAHNLILQTTGELKKYGTMENFFQWNLYIKEGENITFNVSNQAEIGYVQIQGADPSQVLIEASKAASLFCETTEIQEIDV